MNAKLKRMERLLQALIVGRRAVDIELMSITKQLAEFASARTELSAILDRSENVSDIIRKACCFRLIDLHSRIGAGNEKLATLKQERADLTMRLRLVESHVKEIRMMERNREHRDALNEISGRQGGRTRASLP